MIDRLAALHDRKFVPGEQCIDFLPRYSPCLFHEFIQTLISIIFCKKLFRYTFCAGTLQRKSDSTMKQLQVMLMAKRLERKIIQHHIQMRQWHFSSILQASDHRSFKLQLCRCMDVEELQRRNPRLRQHSRSSPRPNTQVSDLTRNKRTGQFEVVKSDAKSHSIFRLL